MKKKQIACVFLLSVFVFCGCMKLGVDIIGAPTMSRIIENMGKTRSYKMALEGLPGDILMAAAVTELSPDNRVLLADSSYMHFAYGLFVEDQDRAHAEELYQIGRTYGMRALKLNPEFRKGLEAGLPIHKLVHHLGPEYAPALCWTSVNSGLWMLMNLDDPASLMETANILAMARQSVLLDETYFHGVAKAFLGCYYAMVPKALDPSGGPENSARVFREARAVDNGNMLLIDLFEARFLAANMNDEDRFDFLLDWILSADSDMLENGFLYNELAKEKARFSRAHRSLYF